MKKIFLLLGLTLIFFTAKSQYDINGDYKVSGRIGIGTVLPAWKLDIQGEGTKSGIHLMKTDAVTASWYLHPGRLGKGEFTIGDDFEYRLAILTNGYVGIGTINPASKFEVNGDISLARTHKIKFLETVGGNDRAYIRSTNGQNGEDYNSLIFAVNIGIESMIIKSNGNIGIGTTDTKGHKLGVAGTVIAEEVIVALQADWADFVFNKDYKLKDLEEVENFIEENNHLPDIPSEKEVVENGIQVGEMNAKLLQKIEELTLYMIEQNKETKAMKVQLEKLADENKDLKEEIKDLKETIE